MTMKVQSRFDQWENFADRSGIAVIVTDIHGVVRVWSHGAVTLYGWSESEAIGRPIQELTVGPTDAAIAQLIMDDVVAKGAWEGEFHARSRSGQFIEVHVRDFVIDDEDGKPIGIVGLSFDVRRGRRSMRERAEGLRGLAREVNEARQHERQTIARNLHDYVGQILTVLRTEIMSWVDSTELPQDMREMSVQTAIGHLDSALQVVRDISGSLLDVNFDIWMMVLRVFDMLDDLQRRTGIITNCDIDGIIDDLRNVDREVAFVGYQVVREALVNCERHSKASLVTVSITVTTESISLQVMDNGVGVGKSAEGVGRRIMHDRVAPLGGSFSISDRIELGLSGTVVDVVLPLAHTARR